GRIGIGWDDGAEAGDSGAGGQQVDPRSGSGGRDRSSGLEEDAGSEGAQLVGAALAAGGESGGVHDRVEGGGPAGTGKVDAGCGVEPHGVGGVVVAAEGLESAIGGDDGAVDGSDVDQSAGGAGCGGAGRDGSEGLADRSGRVVSVAEDRDVAVGLDLDGARAGAGD